MKNTYYRLDYLSLSRWNSFWHQINEVVSKNPKNVLEVGVGSGINSFVLGQFGIKVTTVDNDPKLSPNVLGSVTKIPLKNGIFDVVTCFQVLEHLPFGEVAPAIKELARVSRRYLIISVPEPYNSFVEFRMKFLPFIPKFNFVKKIAWFPKILKPLPKNGPHFWELGREGFESVKFEKLLKKSGLTIINSFYTPENLYHRFYVLEKRK